ncbi:MAG: hypothetical protein ACRDUY_15395 [Nitriliruptorales bacterium]
MDDERTDGRDLRANVRSYTAAALGAAAVFIVPIITGPVALVLGTLARIADEPLARPSLWVAGVGTFLGLVNLFAAI